MKKHLTRLLAGLLAAGALVLPARAASSYKHTYHTQIVGRAEITLQVRSEAGELLSEETKTVEYESEFVEGGMGSEGPMAELAIYEAKVSAAIGDAKILDHQPSKNLAFDHFESSNIIEGEGDSVKKTLDVHEYQIYSQTDTYLIEKTQAAITPPTNPEPPADSEPPMNPEPSADPEPPTSSEPGASEPLPDDAPQTSEPAEEPVQERADEKKGISLWWILPAALVLCAGLGVGGYFLWKKKKSN